MKIDIAIESIDKAVNCRFGNLCLEKFDSTLCCEIEKETSHTLIVRPVSSFKSTNCTYRKTIQADDREVNICLCPVRIAIYRKYKT